VTTIASCTVARLPIATTSTNVVSSVPAIAPMVLAA